MIELVADVRVSELWALVAKGDGMTLREQSALNDGLARLRQCQFHRRGDGGAQLEELTAEQKAFVQHGLAPLVQARVPLLERVMADVYGLDPAGGFAETISGRRTDLLSPAGFHLRGAAMGGLCSNRTS